MAMSDPLYGVQHFINWKPPPPFVENRTSRDVTLSFCAGPYSFLADQLLYKVEKKEKIPPWVVVYSGGKTTKTIANLAPCHPHRFRLRVIIKSTAAINLAERLIDHYGERQTVCGALNETNESEDQKQSEENSSSKDAKTNTVVACTIDLEKELLSPKTFERESERDFEEFVDRALHSTREEPCVSLVETTCENKLYLSSTCKTLTKKGQWLESSWSDDTWTSTDSDGTSAVCFCMAVRCGYLKQVQQMLEARPLLISVINYNNGFTPLATAVRKGDVNMVKFLLSVNAEIEQRSSSGQTPLHLAVLAGHIAVADILLEKGADFQARDFNQLRIEHYAVDSCKLEVVRFILDKGGDVGVRDSNGWTPLFRAVCQGATSDVVEELVRRGSDLEITDRAELTLPAAARLLKDGHGRRRESILRLVDTQYQHEKVVANFTRLTKKISSVHTLFKH